MFLTKMCIEGYSILTLDKLYREMFSFSFENSTKLFSESAPKTWAATNFLFCNWLIQTVQIHNQKIAIDAEIMEVWIPSSLSSH